MPDLTVVVPVHNMAHAIEESLRSLLAIPDVSLEIVVWDDGSTDGSGDRAEAIGDERIRVLRGPGEGACGVHAFNHGVDEATGRFILKCDSDDRVLPESIARQVMWMTEHEEFQAAAGSFCIFDSTGRSVCQMDTGDEAGEITDELQHGTIRTHLNTFVIRTEFLRAMGGLRPYFVNAHDLDLQLRMSEAGRIWYNPFPLFEYRLHDSSHCHTFDAEKMIFYDKLALEFQKQRQTRGQDDLQLGNPPEVPEGPKVRRNSAEEHIYRVLIGRIWSYHKKGARRDALNTALQLCSRFPTRPQAWKNLALCAIKPVGKG